MDGGRLNIAACWHCPAELTGRWPMQASVSNLLIDCDFRAIQLELADMATELQAARLMLYDARALDAMTRTHQTFGYAKTFVTDAGFNIANEALQIHGGYGCL